MPSETPRGHGALRASRAARPTGAPPMGAEPIGTASRDGNTAYPSSAASRAHDAARPTGTASRPRTAIEAELARIPSLDEWTDLGARELERRARVLADIRQRVMEHGPHHAIADPDRGRLFMPFAALKGYDDLVKCVEDE